MLLLLLHYLTVSHAFTITSPSKHQNVSPRRQTIRRLRLIGRVPDGFGRMSPVLNRRIRIV